MARHGLGGGVPAADLPVGENDAEQLAASVASILERFAVIARELTADDDMYEFRRLLAQEGQRG